MVACKTSPPWHFSEEAPLQYGSHPPTEATLGSAPAYIHIIAAGMRIKQDRVQLASEEIRGIGGGGGGKSYNVSMREKVI